MNAVKNFVKTWQGRGYEKGEPQKFWLMFLRDVLKVDKSENYVEFEVPVKLEHTHKFRSNRLSLLVRLQDFQKHFLSRPQKVSSNFYLSAFLKNFLQEAEKLLHSSPKTSFIV